MKAWRTWALAGLMLAAVLTSCRRDQPPKPVPPPDRAPGAMSLRCEAFEHGQPVPRKFTADGQDISPALSWANVPEGTKELALIVDDPDAPGAAPWVHWVVYGIPPSAAGLPEAATFGEGGSAPVGAKVGRNALGKHGYGGPSPPQGSGPHRYFFRLYALKAPLELPAMAYRADLDREMKGKVLAEAVLVGTYKR